MSGILMSNPVGALFDKSKGSAQNRIGCSVAHIGNGVKTYAGATAASIGAATLASGVIKAGKDCDGFTKSMAEISSFAPTKAHKKIYGAVNDASSKLGKLFSKSKLVNSMSNKLAKVYDKSIDGILKVAKNISGTAGATRNAKGQFIKTIPDWVKGLKDAAKHTKAGIIISIGSSIAIGTIALAKFLHGKGQVDQKYTDKAKLENNKIAKDL